jgi:long-subunit acyl-CoA synthetase (AMP-forming)
MRAKIELVGSVSHNGRKSCVKNKPFFTTNISDISYYLRQSQFEVTILEKEKEVEVELEIKDIEDEIKDIEDDELTLYDENDLSSMKKSELKEIAINEFDISFEPKVTKKAIIEFILQEQQFGSD